MKYVLLGAVLCAGAALTKQAGLYIAAVYPVLAWSLVGRGAEGRRPQATFAWPAIGVVVLVLAVLIAPWYVYKLLAIHRGADGAVAAYLLHDIHQGRNLWQRLLHAGGLLHAAVPLPAVAALLAAMALALRDPVQRRLTLLVAAPFALLWALGFSYDLRNIALAIPFAAAAAGFGASELGRRGIGNWGFGIGQRGARADLHWTKANRR